MSEKDREPKSEHEARERLEKYLSKRTSELPETLDEPLGPLAGNPDHLEVYKEIAENEDLSPEELRDKFKLVGGSSPGKPSSGDASS